MSSNRSMRPPSGAHSPILGSEPTWVYYTAPGPGATTTAAAAAATHPPLPTTPTTHSAAIHPSRRSMTTVCPAFRAISILNIHYSGPKGPSLQVIHRPQMPRNTHTRVKSAERGSRGAAICSVTYGYTQASAHSYALSQVAGRSSFRYVVQKGSYRTACGLDVCTFILNSAPRWMYICVYILGRSRTAASIQDVTRRLVIQVHLRGTEEHTQANGHISVKIPSVKRRLPGERR
jgi:hypothetical protein